MKIKHKTTRLTKPKQISLNSMLDWKLDLVVPTHKYGVTSLPAFVKGSKDGGKVSESYLQVR